MLVVKSTARWRLAVHSRLFKVGLIVTSAALESDVVDYNSKSFIISISESNNSNLFMLLDRHLPTLFAMSGFQR